MEELRVVVTEEERELLLLALALLAVDGGASAVEVGALAEKVRGAERYERWPEG